MLQKVVQAVGGNNVPFSMELVCESTSQNYSYTVTEKGRYFVLSFGNGDVSTSTTDISTSGEMLSKTVENNLNAGTGKRSVAFALIDADVGDTISKTCSNPNYTKFIVLKISIGTYVMGDASTFIHITSDTSKATKTEIVGKYKKLLLCYADGPTNSGDLSINPYPKNIINGEKFMAGVGENETYIMNANSTGAWVNDWCCSFYIF